MPWQGGKCVAALSVNDAQHMQSDAQTGGCRVIGRLGKVSQIGLAAGIGWHMLA